eukprot:8756484-Heterocapsa_arctica.AAC.1
MASCSLDGLDSAGASLVCAAPGASSSSSEGLRRKPNFRACDSLAVADPAPAQPSRAFGTVAGSAA